ncbi:MAG: DUF1559 domain-containing protein [Armatimonadota bacterium]
MKRSGFTLIELLVVIAIIAILAAILFPVFAKAREKARQSSCLSNVKQMILGVMSYAQDYDEKYPGGLNGAPGAGQGPVTQSPWFTDWKNTADVIFPYVKNTQLFRCPSSPDSSSSYAANYGFNSVICPNFNTATPAAVSMGQVARPAEAFCVLDAGPYMVGWGDVTSPQGSFWYVPGTCGTRSPAGVGATALTGAVSTDFVSGRHNQGINVGLADGHAKWFSGSTIIGHPEYWTLN